MYPCQPQLETAGGPRPERLGGELRAGRFIFQFGCEVQAKLFLALGSLSVCSGHPAPCDVVVIVATVAMIRLVAVRVSPGARSPMEDCL